LLPGSALTSASASNPPPTKGTADITKLTEDIIHIHSGMTSASAKPPEPSKLGDRIDRILLFCLGH
jgi:hypothetical protein